MHTHISLHAHMTYAHTHIYAQIHACKRAEVLDTSVGTHRDAYRHAHIDVYIQMYTYIDTCIQTFMHAGIHLHLYWHTCMHACRHAQPSCAWLRNWFPTSPLPQTTYINLWKHRVVHSDIETYIDAYLCACIHLSCMDTYGLKRAQRPRCPGMEGQIHAYTHKLTCAHDLRTYTHLRIVIRV